MINLSELLSVKSETFKLNTIDLEVKLKQMTIAEYREYLKVNEQNEFKESMFFALEKCMVEPAMVSRDEFFSDDLLPVSASVFQEVFLLIPKIGKTKKEIEDYENMISNLATDVEKKSKEEIEEEVEKK